MLFNCSNLKSESPMMAKHFIVVGDGRSNSLKIALESSPVGMEFRGGKKPKVAFLRGAMGTNCEALLDIEDGYLKMAFTQTPAQGERIEMDIEFLYSGE